MQMGSGGIRKREKQEKEEFRFLLRPRFDAGRISADGMSDGLTPRRQTLSACAYKKNAGQLFSRPAFQVSAIKQKLNCALFAPSSLAPTPFGVRSRNGMSEIPKNFRVSRRPIQTTLR